MFNLAIEHNLLQTPCPVLKCLRQIKRHVRNTTAFPRTDSETPYSPYKAKFWYYDKLAGLEQAPRL